MVVVGVLLICAFAASSAYDAWRSYRYSIAATERELGNLANALAEQTAWSLEAVDLLLLDTARWYRHREQGIPPEGLDAALAARATGVQPVREVTIMDARGQPAVSIAGIFHSQPQRRRPFLFHCAEGRPEPGIIMSEPLTTRSEGRTAVILSRRIDDAAGHFAGIVTANVDLEDLERILSSCRLGTPEPCRAVARRRHAARPQSARAGYRGPPVSRARRRRPPPRAIGYSIRSTAARTSLRSLP